EGAIEPIHLALLVVFVLGTGAEHTEARSSQESAARRADRGREQCTERRSPAPAGPRCSELLIHRIPPLRHPTVSNRRRPPGFCRRAPARWDARLAMQ